ncbi:fibro-slime domain-containing protein [Iningainema tapete]|uniref:Fibro-slime domain-containing protein n=1 Tax=Iningainema tapete BLCC-T55 TaxID=2748662 RepID=A0A8J6XZI1_9CYAN|nr:fibro-slime domain-containing protein [Iningainema tapete]MBD2778792.1 fibro-slime domain-containing protein [Iningainema tapete BLCC-T55]
MSDHPDKITINAIVRDFRADHPDFETDRFTLWNRDDLRKPDKEIVQVQLSADNKPIYNSQHYHLSTSGQAKYFDQWYRDVPGVNKSFKYPLVLEHTGNGNYKFESYSFFPLDGQQEIFGTLYEEILDSQHQLTPIGRKVIEKNEGVLKHEDGRPFSREDVEGRFRFDQRSKQHNYHFTLEAVTSFTYQGTEYFKFFGDDDLWIFIDGKLVIDLGGLHEAAEQEIDLRLTNPKNRAGNKSTTLALRVRDDLGIQHADENLELVLQVGQQYDLRIFYAERHTFDSNCCFYTSLQLKSETPEKTPDTPLSPIPNTSKPSQLIPSFIDAITFDSFERNPERDIVCVTPIRSIIRREEEITIIRRVRKVEEIEASPACPVNTTQLS